MRKGLTEKIDAIIEKVAELECIKPYILCGGTALAMQIGHRKSEDLDFLMWRKSKKENSSPTKTSGNLTLYTQYRRKRCATPFSFRCKRLTWSKVTYGLRGATKGWQ